MEIVDPTADRASYASIPGLPAAAAAAAATAPAAGGLYVVPLDGKTPASAAIDIKTPAPALAPAPAGGAASVTALPAVSMLETADMSVATMRALGLADSCASSPDSTTEDLLNQK
jgi:hypothetical protein